MSRWPAVQPVFRGAPIGRGRRSLERPIPRPWKNLAHTGYHHGAAGAVCPRGV